MKAWKFTHNCPECRKDWDVQSSSVFPHLSASKPKDNERIKQCKRCYKKQENKKLGIKEEELKWIFKE